VEIVGGHFQCDSLSNRCAITWSRSNRSDDYRRDEQIQLQEAVMETREIPRDAWDSFFSRFSRDHETQFVAVEVMGRDIGAQVEGRSLLLTGISPADNEGKSLALMFDSVTGERVTHMVNRPTHVWLQRTPDQRDEALEIESADGTKTLVRFRAYETGSRSDELRGAERFPRKGDDDEL
jgi:hypothetical protein